MRALLALSSLSAILATGSAADASGTPAPGEDPKMTELARSLLAQFQSAKIDHSVFDAAANAAFTDAIVRGVASQIGPLGAPSSVVFVTRLVRGSETVFVYRDVWTSTSLKEGIAIDPDGKVGGVFFRPDDGVDPTPAPDTPSPSPHP